MFGALLGRTRPNFQRAPEWRAFFRFWSLALMFPFCWSMRAIMISGPAKSHNYANRSINYLILLNYSR